MPSTSTKKKSQKQQQASATTGGASRASSSSGDEVLVAEKKVKELKKARETLPAAEGTSELERSVAAAVRRTRAALAGGGDECEVALAYAAGCARAVEESPVSVGVPWDVLAAPRDDDETRLGELVSRGVVADSSPPWTSEKKDESSSSVRRLAIRRDGLESATRYPPLVDFAKNSSLEEKALSCCCSSGGSTYEPVATVAGDELWSVYFVEGSSRALSAEPRLTGLHAAYRCQLMVRHDLGGQLVYEALEYKPLVRTARFVECFASGDLAAVGVAPGEARAVEVLSRRADVRGVAPQEAGKPAAYGPEAFRDLLNLARLERSRAMRAAFRTSALVGARVVEMSGGYGLLALEWRRFVDGDLAFASRTMLGADRRTPSADWTPGRAASTADRHYLVGSIAEITRLAQSLAVVDVRFGALFDEAEEDPARTTTAPGSGGAGGGDDDKENSTPLWLRSNGWSRVRNSLASRREPAAALLLSVLKDKQRRKNKKALLSHQAAVEECGGDDYDDGVSFVGRDPDCDYKPRPARPDCWSGYLEGVRDDTERTNLLDRARRCRRVDDFLTERRPGVLSKLEKLDPKENAQPLMKHLEAITELKELKETVEAMASRAAKVRDVAYTLLETEIKEAESGIETAKEAKKARLRREEVQRKVDEDRQKRERERREQQQGRDPNMPNLIDDDEDDSDTNRTSQSARQQQQQQQQRRARQAAARDTGSGVPELISDDGDDDTLPPRRSTPVPGLIPDDSDRD